MSLASSGLLISVIVLVLAEPTMLRAQSGGVILAGATAIADKLPQDVIKLALTGIIVISLVLVSVVLAFLRVMMVLVDKFTVAVSGFASKLCVMQSPQGEAIMRDAMNRLIDELLAKVRS